MADINEEMWRKRPLFVNSKKYYKPLVKKEETKEEKEEETASTATPDTQMADKETEKPLDIPISCGKVQAKLCMEHFLCPGIHQRCIEYNGEMMTPKAFCVMGEKQKLKDWKNAIRLNGKSIRKCMDRGTLDFHKHKEICTGRCMSRHYGASKYDVKIENLQQANEATEWSPFVPFTSHLDGPEYSVLRDVQGIVDDSPERKEIGHVVFPGMEEDRVPSGSGTFIKQEVHSEDENSNELERDLNNSSMGTSPPFTNNSYMNNDSEKTPTSSTGMGMPALQKFSSNNSGNNMLKEVGPGRNRRKNAKPLQVSTNGILHHVHGHGVKTGYRKTTTKVSDVTETKIVKLVAELPDTETLLEDSVSFWQGIREMGLLEDIIRDAKHSLDTLKNDMGHRSVIDEGDARKLSDVVSRLGLVTKIKWRMAEHKTRTETEKERLLQEIQELRQKVFASEVRQQAVKRKSDCFDSLLKKARSKCSTAPTSTSLLAEIAQDADSSALVKSEDDS